MWDGICAASKAAVAAAALPASAYKSVGFSSQRGTVLMLDENKNNLMPSIVWNDGRALKYQEEFGKEISPEDYQTHTGMQLSPLWSAAKIAWLRDNDRDVFSRTRWFANGQEYFLHRMGADEWVTDPASLTLNGMMEIGKLDWSDRDPRAVRHRPRPRAAGGHPVRAGRHAVGDGRGRDRAARGHPDLPGRGRPAVRGDRRRRGEPGAGRVHRRHRRASWSPTSTAWTASRAATCGGAATPCPAPGTSRAARSRSGASLKWWRDNLGATEQIAADTIGESVYSLMVNKALTAPAGANGLLFHSFLASQVTPYYDAASRGGWLGLGLYHTRADMIRALLEGCAHEMRMVVDAFQSDIEGGITDLRLTGGGTKSDGFAQIMTDIIGQPTKVTRERECTVFGAAILGAFGSGAFSSIDEAVEAMVNVEGEFEPNASHQATCTTRRTPSTAACTRRSPTAGSTRSCTTSRPATSDRRDAEPLQRMALKWLPGTAGSVRAGPPARP